MKQFPWKIKEWWCFPMDQEPLAHCFCWRSTKTSISCESEWILRKICEIESKFRLQNSPIFFKTRKISTESPISALMLFFQKIKFFILNKKFKGEFGEIRIRSLLFGVCWRQIQKKIQKKGGKRICYRIQQQRCS